MWRLGCLASILVVAVATTATLGVLLAAIATGVIAQPPPVHAGAILAVVVGLVLIVGVGRAVRGLASPVEDLVEAAGRIEQGDYGVRVPERGARDLRAFARAFNDMTARLETTDAQRRTFIADVTHELRTPLTVIRGQAEGILDGLYGADAEHLEPILEQTRLLEHLVEDLRTLALVEAGNLSLARERVDLPALVEETALAFSSAAQAAGIVLQVEATDAIPAVEADPARIRGVLANLLTNALRHTPAGGSITVHVGRREGAAVIEVSDTGQGIPEELLPHVFERFAKGPGSAGSGLGLTIARDLVLAHGGTIEAISRPGEGTTIRFTLPLGGAP